MADEEQPQQEQPQEQEPQAYERYDYYGPAKKYKEFSKREVDIFISSFKKYDTDKSGAISAAELEEAFKQMGQGVSKEEIAEIIESVDADHSGEIEWPEFLQLMRQFYPWKRAEYFFDFIEPSLKYPEFTRADIEVFADAFREFDADQSGTIELNELDEAFKSMGQGCSKEELEKIIERFDTTGTGHIHWVDYLEMMSRFYPEKRWIFEWQFMEPARKFPWFSRPEINVFVQSFREFDLDGNGNIDESELATALKRMGQGASPEKVQEIIKSVDKTGAGVIVWEGFLEIMTSFYPFKKLEFEKEFYGPATDFPWFTKQDIEIFIEGFREFDLDGSGSIDTKELQTAFRNMGMRATEDDIKEIITKFNKDGSGEIKWPEFLDIMGTFYPSKKTDFEKEFLEPAKEFNEFDNDDIGVFIESFREYDTDGSGTIDEKELEVAFTRMGQGVSAERRQKIIEEFGKNGVIEWVGFLKIMRSLYSGRLNEAKSEPAPAKAASTPAPAKTTSTPAPAKTTSTPAPAKTATATPAKTEPAPAKTTSTPAPAKTATSTSSTSAAPAKTTSGSTATPAKSTSSTAAPAKSATYTAATPSKSTSTTATSSSATPAKSTSSTAAAPAKSTTTSSTATPAKSSSDAAAKPQPITKQPSSSGVSIGMKTGPSACASCGKTVYPIEEIKALDLVWHKACFKCQADGCGITLTLKTFKGHESKVYCGKHVPQLKASVGSDSFGMSAALNAPKTARVQGIQKDTRRTFAPGKLDPVDPKEGEEQ